MVDWELDSTSYKSNFVFLGQFGIEAGTLHRSIFMIVP